MSDYQNCALFIGVGDYSAYDGSLDNPPGTSDLPGAKLDALAFYRICTRLGIPAKNLRILTAPRLDPDEVGIPAECVGDATQAAILSGLEWLADRLAGEGKPPGLMTYSGHGDFLVHLGLVLCPSNTVGPNLEHAIPYRQVQSIFADKNAEANLTIILDTCHSGAAGGRKGRRGGSLSGRTLKALKEGEVMIGNRMIEACEPQGLAWRGMFSGVGRGALSWAAAATLDQWSAVDMGDYVELDLSYGQLVKHSQALLDIFDFKQTLMLRGRTGTKVTPFFHRGIGPGHKKTSKTPTAVRGSGQVGPDVKLQLELSTKGNPTWQVASVSTAHVSGYNQQTEYWALDASFSQTPATNTTLTFSYKGEVGKTSAPAPLTNPRVSLATPTELPQGSFFCGTSASDSSVPIALGFDLTFPAGKAATGDITWYAATNTGSPPTGALINPTSGNPQTLTYGRPSTPSGYSWYMMKLPALIWPTSVVMMPGGYFSGGSSMTTMGSTLYMANNQWRPNKNNTFQICSSTNGKSWTSLQAYQNLRIKGAPAISAVGNDTLYYMYCDINSNHLYQGTYQNRSWTAPSTDTGIIAGGGPALATCNGILCLAYQQSSNKNKFYTRVLNQNSWQATSDPGTASGAGGQTPLGQPTLAALHEKLFLAFSDTSNNIQIFQADSVSTTKITWPTSGNPVATLSPPSGTQWMSASLSVWNHQLVLTIGDQNNNVWVCFSSDGVNWSGYQNLTSAVSAVSCYIKQIFPAIGSVGSTLVVSFSQNSGGKKFSSIATTSTPVPGSGS